MFMSASYETFKHLLNLNCEVYAEKPQKDIHAFVGTYKVCIAIRILMLICFLHNKQDP